MPESSIPKRDARSPFLEFDNVTIFHGEKKVLDSLSVTLRQGENVAILGPNGAGQSTFIRTITREFYPVLEGSPVTFRICGKDTWDVFHLRSAFGIVSNDLQYAFTREITGREVVLSGFFSSIGLFNQEVTLEMQRKAGEIISFLEVGHIADRPMTEMSSGESRRFLIGRAMVHDPRVLILDEPTNSLDLHALHRFRQTIRKIAQSGTGIILVTHNLPDIIPEVSRVILMKEGRFVKDGAKADVLTDQHIGSLFDVPVQVREEGGYYYATGY
ncbi:MAG TPA: ATP-binding cassette domain-containing protein [Methanoregula sp.]|nr:ATP-binding cassette domain-containing protein [Methanoregula sp.]